MKDGNQRAAPDVCYVLGEFPSKTEYFIYNEILALQNAGLNIEICALKQNSAGDKLAIPDAIPVHYPPTVGQAMVAFLKLIFAFRTYVPNREPLYKVYRKQRHTLKLLRDLILVVHWSRVLKRNRPRRVHAHFASYPADLGFLLSAALKVPFSFTSHAHDLYADQPDLSIKLAAADFVLTCTGYNKVHLTQLASPRKPIHCIYHGLDLNQWRFVPKTAVQPVLQVLSVGRLQVKKGHRYLLEALRQVSENGLHFQLHIIGEGPEEGRLMDMVSAFGLADRVQFHGYVQQSALPSWYARMDLMVQASIVAPNGDRDGIPNVLVEAMACGLPVIGTAVSGIPELIQDGETGLLVPEKDAAALATAILSVARDTDLWQSLSQKGRAHVEAHFSISKATAQLMALMGSGNEAD